MVLCGLNVTQTYKKMKGFFLTYNLHNRVTSMTKNKRIFFIFIILNQICHGILFSIKNKQYNTVKSGLIEPGIELRKK